VPTEVGGSHSPAPGNLATGAITRVGIAAIVVRQTPGELNRAGFSLVPDVIAGLYAVETAGPPAGGSRNNLGQ